MDVGILDLDSVPVQSVDVLHGDGMVLLRQHLAGYRPLVTATALAGAASVFDTVTTALAARHMTGDLPRLRDSHWSRSVAHTPSSSPPCSVQSWRLTSPTPNITGPNRGARR